jgi:hypothetical protein
MLVVSRLWGLNSTLMELRTNVLFALGVFGLFIWQYLRPRRHKLPPGPRGLPLIGSAFSIPPQYSWNYYTKLKAKYGLFSQYVCFASLTFSSVGDLVYISAMGKPIVLLNSYKVAYDLLVRRASIYSDRTRIVMVGEM